MPATANAPPATAHSRMSKCEKGVVAGGVTSTMKGDMSYTKNTPEQQTTDNQRDRTQDRIGQAPTAYRLPDRRLRGGGGGLMTTNMTE